MAYSRAWLRTQLASFLKDSSLSAELDTFIDLGAKRASQILECWEMEQTLANQLSVAAEGELDGGNASASTVDVVDGGDPYNADPDAAPKPYIEIPSTVRRILGVQVLDSVWRNLKAMPRHDAAVFKAGTGTPAYYYVETRYIYPIPMMAGSYRTQVIAEVQIPETDTGEVDALTSYPMVFLNAALAEAYDWKQDPEMSARYEQKWIAEAQAVRSAYRGESQGEALAMRAT